MDEPRMLVAAVMESVVTWQQAVRSHLGGVIGPQFA